MVNHVYLRKLLKKIKFISGSMNIFRCSMYVRIFYVSRNLQAAICAYFDLQSSTRLPQMTFVKDVTIGEGESVPPNTRYVHKASSP